MTQPEEIWKPVVGWEAHYAVSNKGRVMRTSKAGPTHSGKIRAHAVDGCGYARLPLCVNYKSVTCKVHRLVAEAFIGPIPRGYEVNHKDGDRLNNCVENLEICTHTENVRHSRYILKNYCAVGEKNARATVKEADVVAIRQARTTGLSYSKLAILFGVKKSLIADVCMRRCWKHLP